MLVNSKRTFWCLQFFQKDEQKQVDMRCHSTVVEFFRSFFGRIHDTNFRNQLTFSNWVSRLETGKGNETKVRANLSEYTMCCSLRQAGHLRLKLQQDMPSNIQVLPLNLAVEVEEERGHTSTISQLLGTNIAMVVGFQVE